MKAKLLFLIIYFFTILGLVSQNIINSDQDHKAIVLSGNGQPKPHAIEVAEPVAMYAVSTQVIEITFDSSHYADYIVSVEGAYGAMQYAVTSPTMYIPTASLGNVVEIYIESEDCGSYYGVLDKTAFISME